MRGQVITEYMAFLGLAFLIALILVAYTADQASIASDARHERAVTDQVAYLQDEILAAYIARDGYTSTIEFTPPYQGVRMNLTIDPNTITVESARYRASRPIPNITASIAIDEGTIRIEKRNDTITVSIP